MTDDQRNKRIADFLFEIGTMRKVPRAHRQTLLTDDMTDNISSHSYRVALIGFLLAKEEGADPFKTAVMCLLHDLPEIRANDHNYVHKRYMKVYEEEIAKEQLGTLPHPDLFDLFNEYEDRESLEATIAKDADLLDQTLLIREYAWQGNKEAELWMKKTDRFDRIQTKSALAIAKKINESQPSDWWQDLSTFKNR
jgi:putative hydrolase of HD superfamily